jgi:hypothetical protein
MLLRVDPVATLAALGLEGLDRVAGLLHRTSHKAANGMFQPAHLRHDLGDGGALGPLQHRDYLGQFRLARCGGILRRIGSRLALGLLCGSLLGGSRFGYDFGGRVLSGTGVRARGDYFRRNVVDLWRNGGHFRGYGDLRSYFQRNLCNRLRRDSWRRFDLRLPFRLRDASCAVGVQALDRLPDSRYGYFLSVNFLTGFNSPNGATPANPFQISTKRLTGHSGVSFASSFWLLKANPLASETPSLVANTVMLLFSSMVNVFMIAFLSFRALAVTTSITLK